MNIIQKYTNQVDISSWIANIFTYLHVQLLARMTAAHLRLCSNFQNSIYLTCISFLFLLLFLPLSGRCTPDSSGRFSAGSWRIVLIIAAILVAIIIFTIISATLVAYWGRWGDLFRRNNKVHPLPTNASPQWWCHSSDIFTTWLFLPYCDVILPMLIRLLFATMSWWQKLVFPLLQKREQMRSILFPWKKLWPNSWSKKNAVQQKSDNFKAAMGSFGGWTYRTW